MEYWATRPSKSGKFKFTKYVIFVRRIISAKGFPTGEVKVDIRGQHLKEMLKNLHEETIGFSFDKEPPEVRG